MSWLRDWRVLSIAGFACLLAAGAPMLTHIPGIWSTPERWTEARKGWLYRSAQIPPSDVKDVLRSERIDVVLDLTDDTPDPVRDAERAAAESLGLRYLHLPVVLPREKKIESLARAV